MKLFDKLFGKKTQNEENDFEYEDEREKIFDPIENQQENKSTTSTWEHISEVVLLNWVSNKPLPSNYPGYFSYKYGIKDVVKLHKRLIDKGYLQQASEYNKFKSLTVPEIKNYLRDNNLKLTGNKDKLINRLLENNIKSEINNIYTLTDRGEEFINNNEPWLYFHRMELDIDVIEFERSWQELDSEGVLISGETIALDVIHKRIEKAKNFGRLYDLRNSLYSLYRISEKNKDFRQLVMISTQIIAIELSGLDNHIDRNLIDGQIYIPRMYLSKGLISEIKNHIELFDIEDVNIIKPYEEYSVFKIDQIKKIIHSAIDDLEYTNAALDRLIEEMNS